MYAKIFEQILDSSIADDWQVRHVFMDLLILADSKGVVDITHEALARRTNVPVEIIRRSIVQLCSPDEHSRSANDDGRRLRPLDEHRDWGWVIVNYEHYRSIRDEDARREYFRTYRQKERAKKRGCSTPVQPVQLGSPQSTQEEGEAVNVKDPLTPIEQDVEQTTVTADGSSSHPSSTERQIVNQIVKHFRAVCKGWSGSLAPVYTHFGQAIRAGLHSPESIISEINAVADQPDEHKPWRILDRLNESKSQKHGDPYGGMPVRT